MNEYNKRILEADLPAKYKDGEVLQHIDMNRLEAITRTGINANYEDIQKIQDGTTSVGNAALFMGNTLSKQEDEPLKDDDTKVSSSKQVKTYVDLEIFNRLQGIEDQFYTKDQINAQQATKVDKVVGKELSTNDFTDALKGKLDGIAEGAEVNVQSDWSAIEGDAFIKNKPTIPTTTNELTNNSGFITATDNITGNANTATTANKTVGKLTIQKNGTNLSTFDGSSNRTVNIDVPIVENSLTSTSSTSALSAKQGRELDLTKQNKLIAGNNITITENTISASEPGVGKSEGPNKGEIFNIYNGIGKNVASGEHSHAEGISTKARGTNSHAEGYATEASAFSAHSEGDGSKALGNNSHSEGHFTEALGDNSHSEGQFVSTDINSSHIGGQFGDITNVDDPDTLFAVANGNGSNDRNIGLKFQGLKGNGKLYVEGNEVGLKEDTLNNTKRIKTLETNIFDAGVSEGTKLSVRDSALAEMQEIDLSIDVGQIKSRGINLLDTKNIVSSSVIVLNSANKSEIKILKNNVGGYFVKLMDNMNLPANTYTIWCQTISGNYDGGSLCLFDASDNKYDAEFFIRRSNDNGIYTFKINATNGIDKMKIYKPIANSDVIIKLWLVVGSYTTQTMPKYEPYTGGKVTPTPDFPQEINIIKNNFNLTSCDTNNLFDSKSAVVINAFFDKTHEIIKADSTSNFVYIPCNTNSHYWITLTGASFLQIASSYDSGNPGIGTEMHQTSPSFDPAGGELNTNGNAKWLCICFKTSSNTPEDNKATLDSLTIIKSETFIQSQSITNIINLNGNKLLPGDKYIIKYNEEKGEYWKYLQKNMGETTVAIDRKFVQETTDYFLTPRAENGKDYNTWNINAICECAKQGNLLGGFAGNASKIFWAITYPSSEGKTEEEIRALCDGKKIIYELADANKQLIPIEPVDMMNITYYPNTYVTTSIPNIFMRMNYYRDFINTVANLQLGNKSLKTQLDDLESRVTALETKPVNEGGSTNA